MTPARSKAEDVAVGGWHCPCGEFKFENLTSTTAADVTVECPSCGRRAEIRLIRQDAPTPGQAG